MLQAELRGKLSTKLMRREDLLTSNVFSFFKYANRTIFLFEYLKQLGLNITENDAEKAILHFWPRYDDNTEPDLVIMVGSYYLLFEAKLYSGFGMKSDKLEAQLVRQANGGLLESATYNKDFYLITITADNYFKPSILSDIPLEYHGYVKWTNWQKVALLLSDILDQKTELQNWEKHFAEDLYLLLDSKNLRNYKGVNSFYHNMPNIPAVDSIFFLAATAKFRGDFIGFSQALVLDKKLDEYDIVFYNTEKAGFRSLLKDEGIIGYYDHLFYKGED